MRRTSKFVDTDEVRVSTYCTTSTTAVVLDGLQSGTKEEASLVTVASSASGLWGTLSLCGKVKSLPWVTLCLHVTPEAGGNKKECSLTQYSL